MKFYGRTSELEQLAKWDAVAGQNAQMTVIVGRRRIGKTTLVKKAFGSTLLYFFVSKKSESLLCSEFIDTIEQALGVDIPGEFSRFKDVFKYLMQLSQQRHITVAIDEFQEFLSINRSVYSEMQDLWDSYRASSKMHLIVCGSRYSLMKRIFEDSREPLFQRASHRIVLRPLDVDVLKSILAEGNPSFSNADLLALFATTGGTPRYLELLAEAGAFTKDAILDMMVEKESFFLSEGKNILVEEFSREYATYFSILTLIASSKTSRSEIEGELEQSVGPQLEKLEKEFDLIRRVRPILSKPNTRRIKYEIEDIFLTFWFRFIYKNQSAIEIGNLAYVRQVIDRDYSTYAGAILERYFKEKLALSKRYSAIGSWWNNSGSDEIDIVALNDAEKTALFAEVKLQQKRLRTGSLSYKAEPLLKQLDEYAIKYVGLSIQDL
jgi:AAA+ ATPase superfamily predicted ATPase